ncbi:tape measure protein [Nocardioides abyssi]|uniref:Tape measure protein n=1 Tax=Nocardioides abyssi TaxID=3058370 RepID=A0ABT8EXP4_9ACTN|nr:tape measure protein [Nocardioides abyssi]MDN4162943.1 tape measure protein [Nocardioides abyssi]
MKAVEKQSETTGKKMGSNLSNGIGKTLKVAGGGFLALGAGIATFVDDAARASDSIKKFNSTMTFAGFSQKEIDAANKRTQDYANKTVYELNDIQNVTAQLAANGVKGYDSLAEAAGNLNAVAGGNSETFKSVGMVMTQTAGAGKLTTENWNQLADAIPGASGILQKTLKENGAFVGDFREAMANGEISADEFNAAVAETGNSKAAKKAATSTDTWEGAIGNLQASIVTALIPVLTGLQPVFNRLSGFIVDKVIPAFTRLGGWMKTNVVPPLKDFGNFVKDDVVPTLQSLWGLLVDNKDILGALAGGLAAAGAALVAYNAYVKVTTAVTTAWNTIQKILNGTMKANPLGLVVTAIGLLVAGLIIAYKKSDTFRAIVQKAWAGIKAAVKTAWDGYIKPALKAFWNAITNLGPTIKRLWNNVVKPTFKAIGAAIKGTWNRVVKPVFNAWKAYFTKVLFPVLRFLWNNVVRPVMAGIGKLIKGAWNNVIKPVFEALGGFIREKVAPAFRKGVDRIGEIWNGLKAVARKPVEFLVNTVYNDGIRAMMNKIPGVNLPSAHFATGGVLPGYTPGRDVHQFVSPTGGRLALSGGEAIMRPEFTRLVGGKRGVEELNRQARRGSLHSPLHQRPRDLGGYFLGGVLPMIGATSAKQHSGYEWAQWAGDLNGIGDDTGKPAVAWKNGVVAYVRSIAGSYGNHVAINHGGQSTLYAHLSAFAARAGQAVKAGQRIGSVGSTGNSSGPHLHFEVRGGSVSGSSNVAGAVNPGEAKKDGFLEAVKAIPSKAKAIWSAITSMGSKFGPWGEQFRNAGVGALRGAITAGDNAIPDKIKVNNFPDIPMPDNPIKDALSFLGIFDNGGILEPGHFAYNASNKPEAVFNQKQFKAYAENAGTRNERPRRSEMVITNWNTGEGYIRDIARDEVDSDSAYNNNRRGAYV